MNILYTGRYYPTSPRGLALRQGLRSRGHVVYEVAIDHAQSRPWNWRLASRLKAFREPVDAVILADLGQVVAASVSRFARERHLPLVVDFFFSLYEAMVEDRGVLSASSWRAQSLRRDDLRALNCADAVFFDTPEHLLSAQELYPGSFARGHVVPIGCPEHFFEAVTLEPLPDFGEFNVLFWGSYIPLQGIEHILQAARVVAQQDAGVKFFLIGKEGLTYTTMRRLAQEWSLKNVVFVPPIPQIKLRAHIAAADLALGIFGDTAKADRVVPHKVYEALAMGIPTISKDSPAARHLLPIDCCRLVAPGQLADAILALKHNPAERTRLAQAGAQLAREKFHPAVLGRKLEEVLR